MITPDSLPVFSPTLHEEELAWFVENAPNWSWVWAKTFATSAPHSYVMKSKDLNDADYERAVRLVLATGEPANYYSRVNIELHLPQLEMPFGPARDQEILKGFKFWPMSNKISDSRAFNTAPMHMSYGEQTAARSRDAFTAPSQFDFVAPHWEDAYAEGRRPFHTRLWQLIAGNQYIDSLLELGPTTGYAPELGLIRNAKQRYRVVDGSQGMLNQVIYKHDVRDVRSVDPNDYLSPWQTETGDTWHTVAALYGAASYLKPEAIRWALDAAKHQLVLMHWRNAGDQRQRDLGIQLPEWAAASAKAARALPKSYTFEMGDFDVTYAAK